MADSQEISMYEIVSETEKFVYVKQYDVGSNNIQGRLEELRGYVNKQKKHLINLEQIPVKGNYDEMMASVEAISDIIDGFGENTEHMIVGPMR